MKKRLFLLLFLFVFPGTFAMEQDQEDQSAEKWKIIKSIKHDNYIKSVNFNADKNMLVVHNADQAILWNLDDQKVILKHAAGWWKPSFSPDNQYIITAPRSKEIALSDTHGKEIMKIKNNNVNRVVKFNEQGNKILTADLEDKIALWDIEKNKQLAESLCGDCVNIAKFFPHDERLIFIAYHAHHHAKIWDTRSKELIKCKNISPLLKADIHPEGYYLSYITQDHRAVRFCDLRAKDEVFLIDFSDPRSAKFNKTGTHILTTYILCQKVLLWKTLDVAEYLNRNGYLDSNVRLHKRNLYFGKFHPKDANKVITYSTETCFNPENNISIWDINGKELATLPDEKKLIGAKFDRNGNYIISKHVDNKGYIVRLWKKVGGKKIKNK